MKTVKCRIEGISPLLMNRFLETEVDEESKAKNRTKVKLDVKEKLYKANGKICSPSTHIIGTLKKAGAKFQIPGQGKLTYKNLIGSGAVIVEPDMIEHKIQNWETDRRSVVIQRYRIMRERPRFDAWALEFDLEFDEDEISGKVLQEILTYAGRRVGIGDFRPDKGGPFGRFMITHFEEV